MSVQSFLQTGVIVLCNLPTFVSLVSDISDCPYCTGKEQCTQHEGELLIFSFTGERLPDDVEVTELEIEDA